MRAGVGRPRHGQPPLGATLRAAGRCVGGPLPDPLEEDQRSMVSKKQRIYRGVLIDPPLGVCSLWHYGELLELSLPVCL